MRARSAAVAIALITVLAGAAQPCAAYVYQYNKGALADAPTGYAYNGLAGVQDLTSLSPHQGYYIAHPFQMEDTSTLDFVAIGTTKGKGATGTRCGDYYGANWEVYVDYQNYGLYYCTYLEQIGGEALSQHATIQSESGRVP